MGEDVEVDHGGERGRPLAVLGKPKTVSFGAEAQEPKSTDRSVCATITAQVSR
jgi:hypothetical protein